MSSRHRQQASYHFSSPSSVSCLQLQNPNPTHQNIYLCVGMTTSAFLLTASPACQKAVTVLSCV